MNGIIRKQSTCEYLREDGAWTSHLGQAASFEGVLEAVSAVQHYKLRGVEFVYLMGGDSAYDMAYELTDYQGSEPQGNSVEATAKVS